MHVTEFVLRVTHTGRRPIAESVEFFSVTRMGVKIWGFKILAQKIRSSVELYRILDQQERVQALGTELMHSWGLALRVGVFAETKEGIRRNKHK